MQDTPNAETTLARFAAELEIEAIPAEVLHEAKRSLVNIFATALAGCREQAIEATLETLLPHSANGSATLVGRSERADEMLAAYVNAMGANIFDFDDTHEATIIHPAAPLLGSLFAHAEAAGLPGKAVLVGFVAGGEVECRIGNAMSPYHYARGWHITSTCGVFGAAAGVGSMIGLSPDQMLHAFSTAAVQSSGLVEMLGTMAKSASVGGAARNGLASALLARNGFTGPVAPLTGERGFLRVYADEPATDALVDGLGSDWEIATNTYKPYPVGVVVNPVIDACLQLREREGLKLEDVAAIEVTGHPLLRQRTDRPDVSTGRMSQVSAQHAIAIVLLRGRAGLQEFSDEAAAETLRTGRPQVTFHDDPSRDIASIEFVVRTRGGGELRLDILEALGSRRNPLSDAQLEAKLFEAARLVGFTGDARRLADAIWTIEKAGDAGDVVRLAAGAS
ncbi:MmgE/PrpD family protein [Microbaculum marinum]|uniref:MmgE/PrpD family protein n=1 Tax=Microbaculum marinum TaxID=1764581 RepID=A0AAW9RX14_9HYPH